MILYGFPDPRTYGKSQSAPRVKLDRDPLLFELGINMPVFKSE